MDDRRVVGNAGWWLGLCTRHSTNQWRCHPEPCGVVPQSSGSPALWLLFSNEIYALAVSVPRSFLWVGVLQNV